MTRPLRRILDFAASRLVALTMLVALLAIRVINPVPLEILQLRGFDLLQQVAIAPRAEIAVRIVDIDERSLLRLGQWPWSRDIIAEIINRVGQAGALVIGLDVVLSERDRTSPAQLAQRIEGALPDAARQLRALPDHDAVLADTLGRSRIVLGQSGTADYRAGAGRAPVVTPVAQFGMPASRYVLDLPGMVRNLPEFEAAAAGRGVFTLNPEPDGIVRRVPAMIHSAGQLYPALSLEMLRVGAGETTLAIRSGATGVEELLIGGFVIPTDARARLWPHARHHEPARYVSAIDVLEGRHDPNAFGGKIVLLGTSAVGLFDLRTTPLERALPGVEIHAMILEGILNGSLLSRPFYADGVEVAAFLIAALFFIALIPALGARITGMVLPVVVIVAVGAVWWAFKQHNLLFDAVFSVLGLLLIAGYLMYTNYRREERQQRQIRATFGRYMAPSLVSQLARDPASVRLGGERREITILFTDMRDFTSISETMDAQELLRYTNRYLTPVTRSILELGGTINKFIGDAAMAFWNAPVDDTQHARHACLAVLLIRSEIRALNDRIAIEAATDAATADRPVRIGIGVSTGVCSVGNVGAEIRLEYTALGDPVNIASRLESLTKEYGVDNVVSDATIAKAGALATLELGAARVKGREEAIHVHTIVGDDKTAADPVFRAWAQSHRAMLGLAEANDWPRAIAACATLREAAQPFGYQGLYDAYAKRFAATRDKSRDDDH